MRNCLIVLLLCAVASAQQDIRLKNAKALRPASSLRRGGHFLVQFAAPPDAALRAELERRGIRVLRYVPEDSLMLASSRPPDLSGLDVSWVGTLEPSAKVSPLVAEQVTGWFLAIFHPDVDPARAEALTRSAGFDVLPNPALLPGQLLVAGPADGLASLADNDEVAYILPAAPELVAGEALIGCPGPVTESATLGEYAINGTGWSRGSDGVAHLGYFLQSLPANLTDTAVRGEIERAFREWERYSAVSLTAADRADLARTIAIRFARGAHGDNYPFDGPGRVLAHTFYPAPPNTETTAGDMHLDSDETWTLGSGLDLFSVVLHETGHALGLAHSDNPSAVMYPYYRMVTGLASDDIAAIRSLYGDSVTTGTTPKPPTTPSDPPTTPGPATPTDKSAPTLTITSPATTIKTVYSASITFTGRASDNVAVTAVRWSTSSGAAGVADGLTSWSAVIPLLVGTNTVTVRAYDAAGNSGWRSVTVVRK